MIHHIFSNVCHIEGGKKCQYIDKCAIKHNFHPMMPQLNYNHYYQTFLGHFELQVMGTKYGY